MESSERVSRSGRGGGGHVREPSIFKTGYS